MVQAMHRATFPGSAGDVSESFPFLAPPLCLLAARSHRCRRRPAPATTTASAADRLPGCVADVARLVYQDDEGDWLLVLPDTPWDVFARTVQKVAVLCRPQQQAQAQQPQQQYAPVDATDKAPQPMPQKLEQEPKEEQKAERQEQQQQHPPAPKLEQQQSTVPATKQVELGGQPPSGLAADVPQQNLA